MDIILKKNYFVYRALFTGVEAFGEFSKINKVNLFIILYLDELGSFNMDI